MSPLRYQADISQSSFYARAKTAENSKRCKRLISNTPGSVLSKSWGGGYGSVSSVSGGSSSSGSYNKLPELFKGSTPIRGHSASSPFRPRGLFVGSTISSLGAVSHTNSRTEPEIPDSLSHLDPLSLSVNINLRNILTDFRDGRGGHDVYASEDDDYTNEESQGKIIQDDEDDTQYNELVEKDNHYKELDEKDKVPLITKTYSDSKNLSVAGWLKKQRSVTGNPDTYTWRSHLNWYKKTQCTAVLWLMRKATQAFGQMDIFIKTSKWLSYQGKRALAVDWLLQYADHIMLTNKGREDARIRLVQRSLLARQIKSKRAESIRFIQNAARLAIAAQDEIVSAVSSTMSPVHRIKNKGQVASTKALVTQWNDPTSPPPKKADYSTLFRLNYHKNIAFGYLSAKAIVSKLHTERQIRDRHLLKTYATQVVFHFKRRDSVFDELQSISEEAREQCSQQDQAWTYIHRIGQHALRYLIRQQTALEWILHRAERGRTFMIHQENTAMELIKKAQFFLQLSNSRENSYSFLSDRTQRAIELFRKQAAAVKYLKHLPPGAMKQNVKIAGSAKWLCKRATYALAHQRAQIDAHIRLKNLAKRRHLIITKISTSALYLHEIGRTARFNTVLSNIYKTRDDNNRLLSEMARLQRADEKIMEKRKSMSNMDRIMLELHDAFIVVAGINRLGIDILRSNAKTEVDFMALAFGDEEDESDEEDDLDDEEAEERRIALEKQAALGLGGSEFSVKASKLKKPPPTASRPQDPVIGKVGFRRLLLNGRLIDKEWTNQIMDNFFNDIDFDKNGCISFYDFWGWFEHLLHDYNREYPKKQWLSRVSGVLKKVEEPFHSSFVVSLQEKALTKIIDKLK